jgi:phosphatidylglycerol---prolipoprotein diacylglyceryl transferase
MPICTITFPAIDPVFIHLGPIEIRWYALGYIFGLVLGAVCAKAMVRNRSWWIEPPGTAADIDDLLVWVALGVIVGGRLGQVFLYEPRFFFSHPLDIPKLWHGGMSFHGGFVGATLAIILFAKLRAIPILSYLDMCAAVTPISLFLVRLANFVNGELWGRISDVPWAVVFPAAGALPRHPSQIYEAILEGLVLFFLLLSLVLLKALKRPGLVAGCFALGYACTRSVAEIFREPDGLVVGPITLGMGYSIPMALIGIWLILRATRWTSPCPLDESSTSSIAKSK